MTEKELNILIPKETVLISYSGVDVLYLGKTEEGLYKVDILPFCMTKEQMLINFNLKKPLIDLRKEKRYGIYNSIHKIFQFGICERSKSKAYDKLYKKIGKDAGKIRFEVRRIKEGHVTSGMIERKCIK